jgi:hypothetical protein
MRNESVRPVTAGERLYLLIRDEILDLTGSQSIRWANIGTLVDDVSGGPGLAEYIKGATAVHATRRALRFWESEREHLPDESQHVRKVAMFVRREIFPSIGEQLSQRTARAVIAAERQSHRPISPNCRASVIQKNRRPECYLCGLSLDRMAVAGASNALTLEHLWPASMGGDSVEENLLPACNRCQNLTKDAVSWEWLNIHNLVLPVYPSAHALESVSQRVRYAKHYFDALKSIETGQMTLKEAFLRLGPMKSPMTHIRTGLPVTFFDLQTV